MNVWQAVGKITVFQGASPAAMASVMSCAIFLRMISGDGKRP